MTESAALEETSLSDEDVEYLNANFEGWEPLKEEGKYGLVIPNYSLPEKYKPEQSDLMILIPTDYPVANLDMFYFSPNISRKDGTEIAALSDEHHFGKAWQRWSRHYEWNPHEHSIISHTVHIKNILENEVDGN